MFATIQVTVTILLFIGIYFFERETENPKSGKLSVTTKKSAITNLLLKIHLDH